jgi:hypothetical protein
MADPITSELADLMPDTVIIEQPLTFDLDGEPLTYSAPVNAPARVVGKQQLVRALDGVEHMSATEATLGGVYGLTLQTRVTLPVRFSRLPAQPGNLAARQFQPMAVEQLSDENGPHHEKAFF